MRLVGCKRTCILVFYACILIESAFCAISYGKLKIKVQPGHNEHSILQGRSTVVATRDSSFLNQDGDIFKLYKPAILKNAPPDSISFESLRFPGNFLRANIEKGIFNFRMDRPVAGDYRFNKTASFLIQRNTGIRGSGMLRLMDEPYYMCVNLKNQKPTLRAMKDDTRSKKSKLKDICSFYIQKLKPLTPAVTKLSAEVNSSEAIEEVDNPADVDLKKKQMVQDSLSMKESLQKLAKSMQNSHDTVTLRAITNAIKNLHTGVPPPDIVRKLLNDYEDKIRLYQKQSASRNLLTGFPEDSSKKTIMEDSKKEPSKMRNVLLNPSPFIDEKHDKLASENNNLNSHLQNAGTNNVATMKNETSPAAPYFNSSNIASLDFTDVDGPLKYDTISLTKSMLQYLYPQNVGMSPDMNVHSAELTKMGPYTPVNLGDFSKQTHREPSLNIDGLTSSINVPSTRANVSISTMSLPATYAFKSGSSLFRQNPDNLSSRFTDVSETKGDATRNSFVNALYGLSQVQNNTSHHTRSNKVHESSNPLTNNSNFDQHLTMYYVKSKDSSSNITSAELEGLGEMSSNNSNSKPETDEVYSINNTSYDDVSPSNLTESNDTKANDEFNESNVNNSNVAAFDEITDTNVTDDLSISSSNESTLNNTDDQNKKVVNKNNTDGNNQTSTNENYLQSKDEKNNTSPGNATAFPTDDKNKTMENSANNDSLLNNNHLTSNDDKQQTLSNITDTIGKISIAAITNHTESVTNAKNYISKNETENGTVASQEGLFDTNDPLKDLITEFKQGNTSKGDENIEESSKKNETIASSISNVFPGNNKNSDPADKNKGKIYSYNDDDNGGTALDTKSISVFGTNEFETLDTSKPKEIDEKLLKNFNLNTSSVSFNGSNDSENDTDKFSSEAISFEKNEERNGANLTSLSPATNETVGSNNEVSKTEDKCCTKDSLENVNSSQEVENTTNPMQSISLDVKHTNSSKILPTKAVEHVEFAKEVEHVEIAVRDKGQSNLSKPVLAKSYVKDKANRNRNKNTTHTIDGNFVVKYDEPLSESTTREIANNIFKAVFNTLNRTTTSNAINSNGVERATIEKNRPHKFTDNLFASVFEENKNNDDDDENLLDASTKDKIPSSNTTKQDGNKDGLETGILSGRSVNASNTTDIDKSNNITIKDDNSRSQSKENSEKNEGKSNENVISKDSDEDNSQMKEHTNFTENRNQSKKLFDFNDSSQDEDELQQSTNKKLFTGEKATNKKPSPEVPLPIEISKLKDFAKNSSSLEKGRKGKDNETEENSQNKEPMILAKDTDGEKEENETITVKAKDYKWKNKTLNLPKSQSKQAMENNTKPSPIKEVSDSESSSKESKNKDNADSESPKDETSKNKESSDNEKSANKKLNNEDEAEHKQQSNETEDSNAKGHVHKLLPTHDDEEVQQGEGERNEHNHTILPEDTQPVKEHAAMDVMHTYSTNTDAHVHEGMHEGVHEGVDNSPHREIHVLKSSANLPDHAINIEQINPHGPRRHTNHIITVKDDNEKETLLNKLVNYEYDKCVFMKLINDIKSPYRLISSVNRHGYKPRGMVFTLKTVLKDPDLHQFVAFRAIDENDPKRVITLDGQKDLVAVPVMCHGSPRIVHVESQQPPKAIATAMTRILAETRHVETSEDAHKKHRIPYPNATDKNVTLNSDAPGKSIINVLHPVKNTIDGKVPVKSTINVHRTLKTSMWHSRAKSTINSNKPIKTSASGNLPIKSVYSPRKSTLLKGNALRKFVTNTIPSVKSAIKPIETSAARGNILRSNMTMIYYPVYAFNQMGYPYVHTMYRKSEIKRRGQNNQHFNEYLKTRSTDTDKIYRGDIIKRYSVRHDVTQPDRSNSVHSHNKG